MKFVQDTIEKKLSRILDRPVTFERLSVSLLSGQVEAEGMIVAGDEPNRPLLTVQIISAKVAVAKALAGQMVIKSLVIEGPALNLARLGDGSLNLPRRPVASCAGDEKDGGGWELEAQSIRLIDGRISFEDRLADSGYSASARQISGEIKLSANRRASVELKGSVDISKWPAIPLPPVLSGLKLNLLSQVTIGLEIDAGKEIRIREVKLLAGA